MKAVKCFLLLSLFFGLLDSRDVKEPDLLGLVLLTQL